MRSVEETVKSKLASICSERPFRKVATFTPDELAYWHDQKGRDFSNLMKTIDDPLPKSPAPVPGRRFGILPPVWEPEVFKYIPEAHLGTNALRGMKWLGSKGLDLASRIGNTNVDFLFDMARSGRTAAGGLGSRLSDLARGGAGRLYNAMGLSMDKLLKFFI